VSVLWLDLIDKSSDVFLDVLYDPLRRTGEAARLLSLHLNRSRASSNRGSRVRKRKLKFATKTVARNAPMMPKNSRISAQETAQLTLTPGNVALIIAGWPASTGWLRDAVLFEPVSSIKFPAHREKTGIFHRIGPQVATFDQNVTADSATYVSKSLVARTGNPLDRAGKFWRASRERHCCP